MVEVKVWNFVDLSRIGEGGERITSVINICEYITKDTRSISIFT